MLHGSISNSEKLAALSCDGARLLFTWMIPHCDNLGRIRADPIYLKAVVVPRTDATLRQVQAWAEEIAGAGLATLYKCQGQRFMEITGWSNFQRIIGNMKRESDLPAPPERSMNAVYTPLIPRSHEVSPEGGGEGGEGGEVIVSASQKLVTLSRDQADGKNLTVEDWFATCFWPEYPRHAGVSRAKALLELERVFKAAGKAKEDDTAEAIMAGLARHRQLWNGKEPEFIPHPATWIHQRRWEDET
jgi:hypothetical protein